MRLSRLLVLPALLVGVAGSIIPSAQARPAAALKVAVAVSPNPVSYNTDAYLSVATAPGATCTSKMEYNNGSTPSNWQNQYKDKWYKAARNGVIIWTWTFKSRHLSSSKATVTCKSGSATATTIYTFKLQ